MPKSKKPELETIIGECEAFFEEGMEEIFWTISENETIPDNPCLGLYSLKDGDHLTIYSPTDPKCQVWSGIIKIIPTETASRTKQHKVRQVKWRKWFFKRYPAKLSWPVPEENE